MVENSVVEAFLLKCGWNFVHLEKLIFQVYHSQIHLKILHPCSFLFACYVLGVSLP